MPDERSEAQKQLDALRDVKPTDADGYMQVLADTQKALAKRQDELAQDSNKQ